MQSVVARIKAADADIGSNAEMDYRIMDGDGPGLFNITTDENTQDGVIILLKVLHIKNEDSLWVLSEMKPLYCDFLAINGATASILKGSET